MIEKHTFYDPFTFKKIEREVDIDLEENKTLKAIIESEKITETKFDEFHKLLGKNIHGFLEETKQSITPLIYSLEGKKMVIGVIDNSNGKKYTIKIEIV